MMRRPASSPRLAALIAALAMLAPRAGRAQATSSENAAAAEALFQEARALLTAGKTAEACPKLAASERLDPGYGTLWNLADCQFRLGQTASAWASFREAADMAKKAGQAERVEKAERRAAELEPKLERLIVVVKSPAPGLVVKRGETTLDAALWGTALPIDPGKHVIEASAPGKKPFTAEITTKGPGQTATIEIPSLADEVVAPPPPVAPPIAPASPARRIAGFAAGGVGVAGVIVGAATGLVARSKWNDAQTNHCRTSTRCDSTGVSLVGDAKTMATVSSVGFVVGGAAVVTGIVLVVTAPASSKSVAISPQLGPGFGGITAGGAF